MMLEYKPLDPDRPAAQYDADTGLTVRASAALDCRRALWYAANAVEETNPPSQQALTQMDAGKALEAVVFRALARDGWRTTNFANRRGGSVPTVRRAAGDVSFTGTPDGRVSSVHTGGEMMLAEVKSRGHQQFRRWQEQGAWVAHPAAVAQLAIYRYGLADREGIAPGTGGVIACIDTDTREVDWEVIPHNVLKAAWEWASRRASDLAAHMAESFDPPARDFEPQDWQCRRCPFRDECYGEQDDQIILPPDTASEEVALLALLATDGLVSQRARAKDEQAEYDRLRAVIAAYFTASGATSLSTTVDGKSGFLTAVWATRRSYPIDRKKLRQYLSAAQQQEVFGETATQYVTIRREMADKEE